MTLPSEKCGEHRVQVDDPLAMFVEAAERLKLVGDSFRCIENSEQLRELKDMIARQMAQARHALDVVALATELA